MVNRWPVSVTSWLKATGVEMEDFGVAVAAYRKGPALLVAQAGCEFAEVDNGVAALHGRGGGRSSLPMNECVRLR